MPCSKGRFSQAGIATACSDCQVGEYSPQFAASTCLLCPPGTSTEMNSSMSIDQCVGVAPKILKDCVTLWKPSNDSIWNNKNFQYENTSDQNFFSPLIRLQKRLFPEINNRNSNVSVVLNQLTLMDSRLVWFLEQSVGKNELSLEQSSCVMKSRRHIYEMFQSENAFRMLECTGYSAVWGFSGYGDPDKKRFKVIFLEVPSSGVADSVPVLHMSLMLLCINQGESWSPFKYSGIPLFGGTQSDSWIHSFGFGGNSSSHFSVLIQASTTEFVFYDCDICQSIQHIFSDTIVNSTTIRFIQGFKVSASGIHLRKRSDNSFKFFDFQNVMAKVFFFKPFIYIYEYIYIYNM
jgi:hypothetical protein